MKTTNILLTGATGFIGRHLTECLLRRRQTKLSLAARNPYFTNNTCDVYYGDFSKQTDWSKALYGQHVVIHAASSSQYISKENADSLKLYRFTNVNGTLNFASQAAKAGVSRFLFISSIKVFGDFTEKGQSFSPSDLPEPADVYGLVKLEIEEGLRKIAQNTGMELVIIRPPLVYGRGVKGNFEILLKMVKSGIPLPLKYVENKRSFVSIKNLVDMIAISSAHPNAANQTLLVSDGCDLSTPELLTKVADAINRPLRMFPCPLSLIDFGTKVIGKHNISKSLLYSLRVDISDTREKLGWEPSVDVDQAMKKCFYDRPFEDPFRHYE